MRKWWFLSGLFLSAAVALAAERPNVVFVFSDDMNSYAIRDLGVEVKTPHLDKLKSQSIIFEHANCAAPVCTSSRAALFSGLYPHTTGVYLNGNGFWEKSERLKNCETFPELFKRSGYTTFGRGKLTHDSSSKAHSKRMWSTPETGNGGFGPFPEKAFQFGSRFFSVKEWTEPDTDFPDVKSANQAIEFLKNRKGDKPFLLMVGLWRPHTPFTAPKRFFDMYDPEAIAFPPGYVKDDMADVPPRGIDYSRVYGSRWDKYGVSNPEAWRRLLHGYLACTSFADDTAGRIIEALDESGLGENTIVIFSSDNGFHMGEKHHFGKYTLWENSVQVPLLVRMPKNQNAGSTCSATISLVDLYPTLRELCGLEKPKHKIDGDSFAAQLNEPSKEWNRPAVTSYGENIVTLRDETWRYIQYDDGSEELYNLEKDPFELTNLANNPETQAVRERFKSQLPKKFAASQGGRSG